MPECAWFNKVEDPAALVLKAGVAHLWFVTIHPFDDGNGRIARAITDLTLARSEKSAQRFYSMSAQIHRDQSFNKRQRLVINRLLNGFEGKLTSSKWAKLAKCSQDTALRDIEDLVARGILVKDPARGRSTSYSLAEIE